MRSIIALLLLSFSAPAGAEMAPLADEAAAWAKSLGHGAVAAGVKRDGQNPTVPWRFEAPARASGWRTPRLVPEEGIRCRRGS